MNIVFTICSNNYLAQAKVLTDSVARFLPGTLIVIGLVDELNEQIDYTYFKPAMIIPLDKLNLEGVEDLFAKYNIVELNTSVKASYFKYLVKLFPSVEKIIYFDPDIQVFQSLDKLLDELNDADIILTPHILTPIKPDGLKPQENVFLNYGIYNLGFLGVNASKENVKCFLNWWEDRILYNGFTNVAEGFFVDQLPMNLVPIFFKNVKFLSEYGYNMAPWNLHERTIIVNNTKSNKINDGSDLYFYHFSSYDYKKSDQLCKSYYTRYNFENRPDLVNIYKDYHQKILQNKVTFFEGIPCSLIEKNQDFKLTISLSDKFNFWIRQFIPPVFQKIKNKYRKNG